MYVCYVRSPRRSLTRQGWTVSGIYTEFSILFNLPMRIGRYCGFFFPFSLDAVVDFTIVGRQATILVSLRIHTASESGM